MKLKLGKDISWDLLDADRTCAIIVYDGKIYEDENNHQSCFQTIFSDMSLDLNDEKEMAIAIQMTDDAFREERLHGFDVYEHETGKFLVSHYPQTLENETIFHLMRDYAIKNELRMATYTDRNKLGNECCLIENECPE